MLASGQLSQPQADDTPRVNHEQAGLIFEKMAATYHLDCSSLTGGYPFEETPAGAFLSE